MSDVLSLLQELISRRSVTPDDAGCQALVAERLQRVLGCNGMTPEITGKYRVGDIRHCYADIGKAQAVLGFAPQVELEAGLAELAEWLPQAQAEDRVSRARDELVARGLAI